MKGRGITLAALLVLTLAPGAWALGKGSSMFAVQVTHGMADLADSTQTQVGATGGALGSTGYISAYSHSEMGLQAQYWYMMSDDYAATLSVGIGFFSETDKPGQTSTAGAPDLKATSSSFNLRFGGDRVASISKRAIVYGGPGIEFWTGKAKYENYVGITGPKKRSYEGESVARIGISARLGGIMMISDRLGLTVHVGSRFGYASAEDKGAKVIWWPSSTESAAGLVFMMGGE